MEKFTKEQKEIINEMYNLQLDGSDFGARIRKAFAEVLKPERKKIIVEIEYDNNTDVKDLIDYISYYDIESKFKVTELPEVFSREQVIDIFDPSFTSKDYIDGLITKWLSERSKK